ncbi:MAG TPA: hypothetical protein VKA25_04450 [Gemmatimonadales bacterium]|nr:hypothetical protein [Gemmatimonadales bacterium]
MRVNSSTRFAAMAALFGALACAGNSARTSDTDETAAARDTTEAQNPPGYRGMERDTTMTPPAGQEPVDTFLQNQGTGQAQDTAGYSGMERQDTTGQQGNQQSQMDTTGVSQPSQMDTTGASQQSQMDTTGASAGAYSSDSSAAGQPALDSTGQSKTGDTTGYDRSKQQNQQQSDTTSR